MLPKPPSCPNGAPKFVLALFFSLMPPTANRSDSSCDGCWEMGAPSGETNADGLNVLELCSFDLGRSRSVPPRVDETVFVFWDVLVFGC